MNLIKVFFTLTIKNVSYRFEIAIKEAQAQSDRLGMLEEAKTMIRVSKHDHIVNIQGICHHKDSVYLLLEFCALGAIDEFLRKQSKLGKHDIQDITQWCRQVADGMGFLADKNIIHVSIVYEAWHSTNLNFEKGPDFKLLVKILMLISLFKLQSDLAARNVLLTHDMKAKIADFGLSTRVYFNTTERKGPVENMVPIRWAALEILHGSAAIIEFSDVWSYGVFMWELFYLGSAVPYGDKKEYDEILDFLKKGHRLKKPPMCPEYIYDLMLDCWFESHLYRPSRPCCPPVR